MTPGQRAYWLLMLALSLQALASASDVVAALWGKQ
jgi:hypothetical protein